MSKENLKIEKIKEKAKAAENEIKPLTVKRPSFNVKTRRIEYKEHTIKSGKEGNSFKRTALIMAFLGIEIIFFVISYLQFIRAFMWFLFIPYGVGIIFACRVAVSEKNSDSKIAWIMFLLILAPIAFIVYLLAGEINTTPLKSRRLKLINKKTKFLEKKAIPYGLPSRISQDIAYIQKTSDYIPYFSGTSEYFPCGEDFFEDVLDKLEKAEKFIYMDFFILSEGHLANAIFEILTVKANAGIDVRIITDGLGSHNTLSLWKVRRIRKSGIKIVAFEPVLPIFSFFINYRDHRKIIVIDGKTGYVGGTNIADEYINAKSKYGVWKDASLRIDGESVQSLTLTFLRMWEYSAKKAPDYKKALASNKFCKEQSGIIIPYADGPNEKDKLGKGVYANIISNAKDSLYIMSPYLIIDNHITDLLKAKAQSGVDVRLIIPGIPDKKIIYSLTLYNAEKLISSGVRVYTYTPGFLHSKVMLSDNECAVVGSINLDFRSFYQQYESAAYIAQNETLKQIEEDFIYTFADSREITLENILKRSVFKRFALACLRLFAPLM